MSDLEPITQEETAWANGNLEPITRKEQYLNRLTGEEQTIPETPVTRIEQYLARLCGEETEIPSSPITREEAYLAYLNGEDVTLPEPITRLEQFMAFAASKSETKPTPLTREEFYWDKYQGGAVLKDFPGLPASIVTVTDALAKPLDSLKVAITPVQSGSGDPSPDNIRPISGWTGAKIYRTSTNVWDEEWEIGGISANNGRNTSSTERIRSVNYISVIPNTNYYYKGINNFRVFFYDVNKNFIEADGTATANRVFTTPANCRYIRFIIVSNIIDDGISINYPSTDTSYHAYTGQDYPITFPSEAGTVYGGTLDVVNGVLTVTKANIASYDGETLPGAWISDRDVYAEGTTPTTGAQVVYDLDTPVTYQLTPTEVQMLLGTNNLWADTGDILEGKYWGKRSSETRAMMNTLRDAGEVTEITPEEPEESDER